MSCTPPITSAGRVQFADVPLGAESGDDGDALGAGDVVHLRRRHSALAYLASLEYEWQLAATSSEVPTVHESGSTPDSQ